MEDQKANPNRDSRIKARQNHATKKINISTLTQTIKLFLVAKTMQTSGLYRRTRLMKTAVTIFSLTNLAATLKIAMNLQTGRPQGDRWLVTTLSNIRNSN